MFVLENVSFVNITNPMDVPGDSLKHAKCVKCSKFSALFAKMICTVYTHTKNVKAWSSVDCSISSFSSPFQVVAFKILVF
jgi:hypothetical protein